MGFGSGVSPRDEAAEAAIDEETFLLLRQVTNEIDWQLSERGMTRADLAARMGVSPGRVSQILSGGENLTLRTLAGLAAALGGRFGLDFSIPSSASAQADSGRDVADGARGSAEHRPAARVSRRLGHGRIAAASANR
jgi:transcriptional regulator with XRE-family HTH domain